jgi:hypothetical protein
MGAWSLTRPGGPGASSPSASAPAASGSPAPSGAAPLAPDDLRVFAVGPIPKEHRFVYAGEAGKERLMLVEPQAGQVVEAARFEGIGSFTSGRGGDIAGTADGSTVVILLIGPTDSRVYVIHPVSGELQSYKVARSETPRLSPDGKRLALSRASDDPAKNGVWLLNTIDGSESRIVTSTGAPPKPGAWSADGRYLALTGMAGGGGAVGVFDTQTPSLREIGPGTGVRWRGNELVYWSGVALSAYDVTRADPPRVVYRTGGTTILRAEVRPQSNEVAAIEAPQSGEAALWLRAGSADRALRGGGNVIAMWWSTDGSKLYVWDSVEATTMVSDALTGTTFVKFCLRGSIAPPCG